MQHSFFYLKDFVGIVVDPLPFEQGVGPKKSFCREFAVLAARADYSFAQFSGKFTIHCHDPHDSRLNLVVNEVPLMQDARQGDELHSLPL